MNDEDRQRQQLDDERRRDDQRRQDELRRQDEQRRQDEIRRMQLAMEEQARREVLALAERRRADEERAREAKRCLDEAALRMKQDLARQAAQLKQDLDARSEQLNKDLWERKFRERAAQDDAFRKIELEKKATLLAQQARERKSAGAARTAHAGPDVFDTAAQQGMDAILALLGCFGTGAARSDPVAVTLPDVTRRIASIDLDAEQRAALQAAVTSHFEAWKASQQPAPAPVATIATIAPEETDVIDEPWNRTIKMKNDETANWESIPARFPGIRLATFLSEEEKKAPGWMASQPLTIFCRHSMSDARFDVRREFLRGFGSTPLFTGEGTSPRMYPDVYGNVSGDVFTIDPYTDAYLCLKGLPRKAVTCPDIQLNGPLEFLSGIATLRSADLVAFNVPWPQDQRDKANPAYRQRIQSGKPSGAGMGKMDEIYPYCHYVDTLTSSDLPCTVQEANAMQANGTLHAYTHSRLFRLRRRGLDAACASGQALGRQLQAGFGLDSRPDFERLWKARFGTPMDIDNMVGIRAEGRKYVEETFPAILQSRPRGLFSRLIRAFK